MGKFCAMRTCKYVDNITPGIKRHRFPTSLELKSKWDKFVVEGNRNNKFKSLASNNIMICERHFQTSCYNSSGKLKKDAVPTIVDKFTPEVAFKFNLIPSLNSELLENVNNFSKSIIKRVRTPEPCENINVSAPSTTMEIEGVNLPMNIFGNGILELMVIDLGEASSEDVTTTDNSVSLSSPEVSKANNMLPQDSVSDVVPSPSFSQGHHHDIPGSESISSPAPRLRGRTSVHNKAKQAVVPLTRPSESRNHDNESSIADTPSPPATRLRSRTSIQTTIEKNSSLSTPATRGKKAVLPEKKTPLSEKKAPLSQKRALSPQRKSPLFERRETSSCHCDSDEHSEITGGAKTPNEAEKEFTRRMAELSIMKRELRNVRRNYNRAVTKIKTLTYVLNTLKEKRRRSDQAPQLDSCLHCGKVLA